MKLLDYAQHLQTKPFSSPGVVYADYSGLATPKLRVHGPLHGHGVGGVPGLELNTNLGWCWKLFNRFCCAAVLLVRHRKLWGMHRTFWDMYRKFWGTVKSGAPTIALVMRIWWYSARVKTYISKFSRC